MSYPEHLKNNFEQIAEKMGINASEMTIVKMSLGVDERHKDLELLQGSWHETRPWIILDEKDHIYTLTTTESLTQMVRFLTSTQSENFQLKLEKAIWQRFPIDFHDVWEVAMDRIRTLAQSRPESTVVNLDLDWLLNEIKQKYPNLFYHLDLRLAQESTAKKSNL